MLAEGHVDKLLHEFQNPLVIFGLFCQGVFMLRFVVQWYASEKRGVMHVAVGFWYISIVGAVLTIVYAIMKPELVLLFSQSLGLVIYLRNLMIVYGWTRKSRAAMRGVAEGDALPEEPAT